MSTSNGSSSNPAGAQGAAVVSVARAGSWIWLLLIGVAVFAVVMVVIVNDPVTTWTMGPTALLSLFAGWCFSRGKVVVDDSGVRVYGGGVVKMLGVKAEDVTSAEAKDISPAEYGGWGLRVSGAGTAFILKEGPGLVVERKHGAPRIYSVATEADGQQMAKSLNQIAAKNAG